MDGSYQLLAARYVRKQTRQLIGQLDGVRKADDIEFVHRARVASRRLRSALRIFDDCFPRKRIKRWRKEIRRVTQDLGAARDMDVQMEFIRSVLSGLKEKTHRPGIARLLLRLEQERQAIQPKVLKAVDRLEAGGVADEMLSAAKKTRSKLKRRGQSLQSPFVFGLAEEHICDRLNELMLYEDSLSDPQDGEQHHAMRIAGKRLRYTMEICQPVYEGRLDEFVAAVKQLQSLLGDIHDCDVWVEEIATFVEAERERTVAYFGHARSFGRLQLGLDHLRQQRRSRREELFGNLVDYWRELDGRGLWDELVGTVQSPDAPPDRLKSPESDSARRPDSRGSAGNGRSAGEDLKGQALPAPDRSSESVKRAVGQ
jgi:CHAD domain-containing protein